MLVSTQLLKECSEKLDRSTRSSKRAAVYGPDENLNYRKIMIQNTSVEPPAFAYERAIGSNDSVYSNYTDLINAAKKKVCKIVVKKGGRITNYATGFMVSSRLLLTNWHVFRNKEEVGDSEITFGYEYDVYGRAQKGISFKLKADDFFHSSQQFDYCLVAVDLWNLDDGTVSIESIGYHYLSPVAGKIGSEEVEFLNIIHHPDGDYMQLSIRENKFLGVEKHTIFYQSDTAPGSSGAPVFNDQWQVVGLHHMGVPSKNDQGEYLDKDQKPIPVKNGQIDLNRIHWVANAGIRISVLLNDIFNTFPNDPYVNALKIKPPSITKESTSGQKQEIPPLKSHTTMSDQIQISIPTSLVAGGQTVNFSINTHNQERPEPSNGGKDVNILEESLLESRRLENSADYSSCEGYKADFLGEYVPIPEPRNKHFAQKLKGSLSIILKYHHFSTIQHSIRKMPYVSAINVDGDPNKRLDKTKRVDKWLRDNRIDYEAQLDENFYTNSGFDRGHMSRREDANWGNSAGEAKLFADMTCRHTNACPQVPTLNQSKRSGLWGRLEIMILEERLDNAKISVFNGPLFSEDDPIFKGVQVPMSFWKIVLWKDDAGQLKATGFKLSQKALVDDINFESLDFDKDVTFIEYQVSIERLQELTDLDFSQLIPFDTYKGEFEKEQELRAEDQLIELLGKPS